MRLPAARPLVALFATYLVLLGWVVLWKLEAPWAGQQRVVKLVPFAATGDAGASTPLEVWVNLLLFIPFGVYLGLLARSWSWWRAAGVVACASLALEVTQYVLGVGSSDTTDVVVNTVGGLAGLGLVALWRGGSRARPGGAVTWACAVGTALALLATVLYVSSPVRFVHVRDVGPLARVGAPGSP
jgi:glycopeptide antibiotics resistance protein